MRRPLVLLSSAALVLSLAPVAAGQHGPTTDHLIGSGSFGTLELVATERVTQTPGLVADVAVSPDGNWAFLANWGEPDCPGPERGGQTSPDAGAWVMDISDPADPLTVGFIPSHQDSRPGEGMQVVEVSTKHFDGWILVMNNEQCGKNGKGGVSLWDVTDPTKPYKLSEHFGDRGGISPGDVNDIHSSFAWDTGDNAYVVIVDNFETTDVDILDITNPKRPRLIREMNLSDEFPGIRQDATIPSLVEVFLHDMVVKSIGGHWVMLLSYWDGGFVQLNVDDPENPTLVGDTDYNNPDPQLFESTGIAQPPEGNGHEAEFTKDSTFFVGTDEDFGPYGTLFNMTTGSNAGQYPAGEFTWTVPIVTLPDKKVNGPTVYGGYGCPSDVGDIPDPSVLGTLDPGEEAILVLQRGPVQDPQNPEPACFFSEKVEAAQNAGYDAVIIANHHVGSGAGGDPDAFLCGSKGHEFTVTIPAVCIGHRAFHLLFNTTPAYDVPYVPGTEPAIGTLGEDVSAQAIFNGWGYIHLFSNTLSGGKFAELDTFAIDEGEDPTFAFGYGDLTVHEVAADPQHDRVMFSSYYAGGMRVLEIGCSNPSDQTTCELVETGGYLDPLGNNFWGVEAYVKDGSTYVLGSDRDSGLWIFKYNPGP